MATVTGYTAEKMDEIANATIVGAHITGTHLILEKHDGGVIDVGVVTGPAGDVGPTGPAGASSFAGYEEPINNLGSATGPVTLNFFSNNVWKITPTGNITLSYSNLPASGQAQPGTLIVMNSTYSITWPVGTKFPDATPPTLNGITVISMFADNTQMYVGTAWSGLA